ncbi:Methyltransferase domain-containing protein [Paenibacillus polysaccharolyticus]|uniref:Methyltransferase domain-containing protein n=1 Tax=Paenibacillus polysaccharolyticus TaxID=582692 RepID=A0A1G5IVB1_9BACL|nr:class I SAM-dependent methyltransferase [Paenibacillus polysaccharolyticus]SCY79650.1 Methyltransferase domain-containing protein [Paenibacillus polysaccharolyticus]
MEFITCKLVFGIGDQRFLAKHFEMFSGMNALNVGIGVGEWDDYIGYLLNGVGCLTSIDINKDICDIFKYRQQKEGHPNASTVICEDFLACELPQTYDLVTMIGSALQETGAYRKGLQKISEVLKPNAQFMYMDFDRYHKKEDLFELLTELNFELMHIEEYNRFSNVSFYCMKIQKAGVL